MHYNHKTYMLIATQNPIGQLILALAFQRYTLTPAGKQLPAPKLSATLRPQGGLWAHVNQRIA